MILGETEPSLADAAHLGRAKRLDDADGRYVEFAKATLPKGQRLKGLRVVIDCANGAAYKVAPAVLWELEADVIPIGVKPDGRSEEHTSELQSLMRISYAVFCLKKKKTKTHYNH